MNRVGHQVLQLAIPAAIGYAVGRYHTASGDNSGGHLNTPHGENFSNSNSNSPSARIKSDHQSSIRSAESDYPAKDFLPFTVPQGDYSPILRAIGGKPPSK